MANKKFSQFTDVISLSPNIFIVGYDSVLNDNIRILSTDLPAIIGAVTGSGTAGKLPKWLTATSLEDSLISDDGIEVTIAGYINATAFVKVGGIASEFLKADGSVDSNVYITLTSLSASAPLSYNNLTGAFSISQASGLTDGYLSSTDWTTFNNKQVALNGTGLVKSTAGVISYITDNSVDWNTAYTQRISSATSPLSIVLNTISIPQANISTNGYLSSTDWAIFNNKQDAGNYITSLTGEATATGPGAAAVTLSNSAVIAKILTGLSITGGAITSSDSIITAFGKVQNQINGLVGGVIYKGTWNALTNTPTLTSSVGTQGYYYIVNVAGSTNLNGITDWNLGDWAIFNGTVWEKVDNSESVISVNGFTGIVSLTTTNIPEGTNLYYTELRVDANTHVTAAYDNRITSATAPLNITSNVISISQSGISTNGYLSSTDWNTFNNKQVALSGTGLVKSTAGVISYITDNSTNWNTAYDNMIVSAAVTGTTTKTLTLTQQDGGTITATWSDIDTGLTSVGLSMPAAFIVTNSPLTSNGTLAVTAAGIASQYIRGDGTLANFPTSGGGGGGVSYYLNGGTSQGTIGGNPYYEMSKNAVVGANADFSINADGYIANFITDAGDPALLNIPAGNWNFEVFFNASSGGGSPSYYVELYKYNGATFTLIASNSANPEGITGGTAIDLYTTALAVPATTLTLTDRLAIRIYVIHSGRTITLHTQGTHLCQVVTTFSAGISALNGLTSQIQYFQTGTVGTDFNIVSAIDTHTFNLPTASAINRGALSNTDWSAFNSKQNAITLTVIGNSGAATFIGNTLNIPQYQAAGTYVNSVTASSPLFSSGGVNPNITIQQASATLSGYLSSTDWTTFDSKQAAGNYITALTGEATASGPGSAVITLTNNSVTAKILTGLNITGGTVNATDSIVTAFGKVQNQINSLVGGTIYKGVWNATTNNPFLASGVGTQGWYYIVNVAGSTNLDGITDWNIGDWAIFDGTAWQQVDNTDSVTSVNGFTGAVSLTTSNITEGTNLYYTQTRFDSAFAAKTTTNLTEGTNLYFTDARARAAISLTTLGTSGAATYSGGVLNIPQYQAAITDPVTGVGTTNYVAKWTSGTAVGNSSIYDNGTFVGIGSTTALGGKLNITFDSTSADAIILKDTRVTSGSGQWRLGPGSGVIGFGIYSDLLGYSPFKIANSGAATFSSNITVVDQVKIFDSAYPSSYATSLRTTTGAIGILQLGNNNDNYILAGNTGAGGYLIFRVNCSSESITSGVEAFRLAASGAATLSSLAGTGDRMVVADASGVLSTQAIPAGSITGSGTAGYITKWTGGTAVGNSIMIEITAGGGGIGIGMTPSYTLDVNGTARIGTALTINGTSVGSTALTIRQSATLSSALAMTNRNQNQTWSFIIDTDAVDDKNFGIYNLTGTSYALKLNGTTNAATLSSLAGSGSRMVVADASGALSTQAIPSGAVVSVFGRTGAVVAVSGDYTTAQVTESGNLYYTDTRARAALSFAAGSGAYNTTTGVITIPTDNNQIANGAGYITSGALSGYLPLTGGTLTGALGGTSANFTGRIGTSLSSSGVNFNNSSFYVNNTANTKGAIFGYNDSLDSFYFTSLEYGVAYKPILFNTSAATFSSSVTAQGVNIGINALGTDRMFQISGNTFTSGATQFAAVINPTMGAVTDLFGIYAGLSCTSATNYYALYLEIATGTITNRWGIYQVGGSDKNYFAGNVGIGTTAPQAKLHSNADILTGYFQNGTNGIYDALKLTNNTASNTLSGNGARIQFYNNTNNSTNLLGSSIRSVNTDYGWASDLILSSVRNNSYTTQTAIDVLTLSSSGAATFSSSVTTGGNLLINNTSVSKKGYKFQSPNSNWSPQESGIFFTPADSVNAATTFSVELWDGNGNTTNALSIAPLGAAKFSSNIGWGGVTPIGDGGNCSTIEGANGAQIAARNGFAQLYISSNVSGTPYAATRSITGYAVQLSLDALGGTISLNRAVSAAAGTAITWISNLGFDSNGVATFSGQVTSNSNFYTAVTSNSLGAGAYRGSSFSIRNNTAEDFNIDIYNRTTSVWYNALNLANNGGAATFSSTITATNGIFNNAAGGSIGLKYGGTDDWVVGENAGAATRDFNIYNFNRSTIELSISRATGAATFASNVTANSFIKSGGTAAQFLKANGSVDSSTFVGANYGYSVPMTQTGDWMGMTTSSGISGWTHVINIAWDATTQNNWVSQIAFAAQNGTGAYYRTTSGPITSVGWTQLLDSNNYTSYIDLSAYLPLTGGTITGDLTVNNKVYVGTHGCYFQEVLISGVYELQVVDSAGNITVIS